MLVYNVKFPAGQTFFMNISCNDDERRYKIPFINEAYNYIVFLSFKIFCLFSK